MALESSQPNLVDQNFCRPVLLWAALAFVSCAARSPNETTVTRKSSEGPGFSSALPLLVQAKDAAREENFDEASRLFERALPLGVNSLEILHEAACAAARRGATDLAFAHLESMRRIGIKDAELLAVDHDLVSLHSDTRWLPLMAHARATSERARNPDAARIVTDDIDHFWTAYDASRGVASPTAIYDREYVDRASPGLQSFFPTKIGTTAALLAEIDRYPRYYESVRKNTKRLRDLEPELRRVFHRLRDIVPDAIFPDITFVIGRMASRGTSTVDGLVIGAEQASRAADSPLDGMPLRDAEILGAFDKLPHLVAHELVHFQQHFRHDESLLASALREGGADFVAELISGDTSNGELKGYGDAHESVLWREFHADMHDTRQEIVSRWLWGAASTEDRPGDLGYYVGYRIVHAYYDAHVDKRRALRDILDVADSDAFLAASGYSPR